MTVGLLALAGIAMAQVEASSTVYFLDIDPARYNGPPGQRIAVQLGDQPRRLELNAEDEICVQLKRVDTDAATISAQVRVLRPVPHDVAEVKVAGPGIAPGTFRSTPWGMLLRVVPPKSTTLQVVKPVDTAAAPPCSL